jgi:hypothetical protein
MAKHADSDGGEHVTTNEIVDISATVAAAWVRTENNTMEIELDDLIDAYAKAGFDVVE